MEADFARHYDLILYRVRYSFPRASADDVVQEAFCEAIRYVSGSTRRVGEPVALLWTIAKRVAIRPAFARVSTSVRSYDVDDHQPLSSLEPWAMASTRETHQRVLERIGGLSQCLADAATGYYLEGLSCRELAERQRTTTGVMKSRVARARQALRGLLRERGDA